MDETQVIERLALIADDQAAEVAEPGEEPFDFPATAIASEWTAILGLWAHPSPAMGRNHLDAPGGQGRIQWISIIGTIADESPRQLVYEAGVEGGRDEGNLVRRSRGGTSGERKTKTVCHRPSGHELRTFAPLGLSHTSAPFFATMNVPSIKHSERSRLPRSFRSAAKASKIRSNVPSRVQRWKRRWQVWYGGYRSGRSAHWAPVRRIHKMPFSTSRLLRQGRPRPSARRGNSPMRGAITAHCSSVKSMAASSLRIQLTTHL
jgi:hypothetical protein